MNEQPETYSELRKMIREAKQIYIAAPFNDGSDWGTALRGTCETTLPVPITKQYAYSLYKGKNGEYFSGGGYTASWDEDYKELWVN